MAGLGFKDFAVGEVATSADVDGYLMQQSVMRFASSAARGSALGTATGTAVPLAEGMVSYLDTAGEVQFYTGTAWRSVTGIRQAVQTFKNDTFSTASTTFTALTGMSVNITPISASSKILVIVALQASHSLNDGAVLIQARRDSTDIGVPSGGNDPATGYFTTPNNASLVSGSIVFLDSPASTSAIAYSLNIRVIAGTGYINRSGSDANRTGVSSITVLEVAA